MSAPPPTVAPARPEVVTDAMPRRRPAWIETATSGDHKVVGLMYIATALSFLVLALTEFVLMRVQLIVPESTIIDPIIFDRLLSTYGATAAVFFGIPFGLGLFCYVVPLQIGARGLAFPRLASLSYWLYLFGGHRALRELPLQPARRRRQSAAAALRRRLLALRRDRRLDRRRRPRAARLPAARDQPDRDGSQPPRARDGLAAAAAVRVVGRRDQLRRRSSPAP